MQDISRGIRNAPEGGPRVRVGRGLSILGLSVTLGCGASTTLPRVTLVAPADGFKMLKLGATTTECRGVALWSPRSSAEEDLGMVALRHLLELDDEADAVVNASFEWASWSIGVYARRCVTLTGDVVRSVRTVRLPMPGGHGDHSGHQNP